MSNQATGAAPNLAGPPTASKYPSNLKNIYHPNLMKHNSLFPKNNENAICIKEISLYRVYKSKWVKITEYFY
jgi:hypothetical protein